MQNTAHVAKHLQRTNEWCKFTFTISATVKAFFTLEVMNFYQTGYVRAQMQHKGSESIFAKLFDVCLNVDFGSAYTGCISGYISVCFIHLKHQ